MYNENEISPIYLAAAEANGVWRGSKFSSERRRRTEATEHQKYRIEGSVLWMKGGVRAVKVMYPDEDEAPVTWKLPRKRLKMTRSTQNEPLDLLAEIHLGSNTTLVRSAKLKYLRIAILMHGTISGFSM